MKFKSQKEKKLSTDSEILEIFRESSGIAENKIAPAPAPRGQE